MTKELKVALLQNEIVWENSERNLENYDKAFTNLLQPVDIVVLPEMFNTGFTMNASEVAQNMNGKAVKWLREKSVETEAAICASLVIEENKKYFNRFIWAENGKIT